jgi:hypothetical protein
MRSVVSFALAALVVLVVLRSCGGVEGISARVDCAGGDAVACADIVLPDLPDLPDLTPGPREGIPLGPGEGLTTDRIPHNTPNADGALELPDGSVIHADGSYTDAGGTHYPRRAPEGAGGRSEP